MENETELTVEGLGEGDPPPEMIEQFGMERVPDKGESDEDDGEVMDISDAEADSEKAANS